MINIKSFKKWLLGSSIIGALIFVLFSSFVYDSVHDFFYPPEEIITIGDKQTHDGLNKIEEILISQGKTVEEINNLLKQLLGDDSEKKENQAVLEYLEKRLQNETIEEILQEKDKFIKETDEIIRIEKEDQMLCSESDSAELTNDDFTSQSPQENQNTNKITIDPNRLTIQFVNQYGNTYNNKMIMTTDLDLYDMDGQKVSGFGWNKYGSYLGDDLYAERLDKKEIPPGTYYIRWSIGKIMAARSSNLSEYKDRYSVQRMHSSGKEQITVPQNGSWFVSVTAQQTNIEYCDNETNVFIHINDYDGSPYDDRYTSTLGRILDENGKDIGLYKGWSSLAGGRNANDMNLYRASWTNKCILPGSYSIEIAEERYVAKLIPFTLPDVSTWSDEEIWEKQPNKIDLGTITLEKL